MRKVYLKRGNRNAQERKMEQAVSDFVEKQLAKDPTFDFSAPRNIVELKDYYIKNCVDDAVIESETKHDGTSSNSNKANVEGDSDMLGNQKQDIPVEDAIPADEPQKKVFIDPMLKDSPIEREYVNEMNADKNANDQSQDNSNIFGESVKEPTNFKDAFGMPNQDNPNDKSGNKKDKDKQKQEPINPGFDDMSGSRRNKQTKRFAKWITKGVCILIKEGFIWWTTKDINPAKLAEYEITNEVDLRILLTLEDGQDATVKEFFMGQFQLAHRLSEISEEEKEDLADALYEYLIEKGVTPNPAQNLAMVGIGIVGRMAIEGFKMTSGINSLLAQLRDMQKNTEPAHEVQQEPAKDTSPVSEVPVTSTELVTQ